MGYAEPTEGQVGVAPLEPFVRRVPPANREQILVEWNRTETEYPRDKCIHKLFEAQVARTPDTVAVVCGNESMTYAELNARANRLAHHLIDLGVGPERLVGVCLERSIEMVVGLLATLKAGGGYLPLDPEYPAARLAQMLADAAPTVVLSTHSARERLPQSAAVLLLDATETRDMLNCAASHDPLDGERICPLRPQHLAYVIYTSGSTGVPKGVVLPHVTLVNLMNWQTPAGSGGRVAQFTSIGFDVSLQEVLYALVWGLSVVVVDSQTRLDPRRMAAFIAQQGVTDLFIPNVVLEYLAEAALETNCALPALANIYQAGEALTITPTLRRFFAKHPGCRLHNHYGPAETHVVTSAILTSDSANWPDRPDIGSPLWNTRVYVLDGALEPVPVGVTGELYIAGVGLARGYLNRPGLTAERFVADPYAVQPGGRMYRTGDLARWRGDGTLAFVGRADQQVKIRGFRIELGEIEAALVAQTGVGQATVMARDSGPRGKQLVAYVVPAPGMTVDQALLRRELGARLPDYMVPSAFVFLDQLPLTRNGKVDRKALPAPEMDRRHLEQSVVAPRTPVEELLAGIWSSVLGVEQVGIHDSFFELGGHSLLATKVTARVRDALQVELPVRSLFEAPTVAELAARIEQTRSDPPAAGILPLRPAPRNGRLPLSFAQERLWFLDQLDPGSATYNIPWIHRLRGPLNVAALERSLQEIVRRHAALRTTFVLVDSQPQVVVLEPAPFHLTVTDLQGVSENGREAEAQRLAVEEAGRPFDLARDVMLRAQLLPLGDQDHFLVVTIHHIASDGWSMGVFERELTALYEAFAKNEPSPLPQLPIQYVDYSMWQRTWLRDAELDRQLAYWKQQLTGTPAVLELPTDFPRPTVARYRGAHREIVLDASLTQALHALSRRQGVTPFMTLLAAFQVLLARYSGQEDVSVGTSIAGRNRTEVEGLIGFFINSLVVRTDLSGNPTVRELLGRVREVTLGAYSHQDLPFEKLVEELSPERSLSHSPLFQVMFVLQNTPWSSLEFPGVAVSRLAIDNATAKLDLLLSLGEQDGQLRGTLEYNTDLFQATTIERLIGHFQVLLEGIVADPDQRIGHLPLLSAAERQQIVVEWNRTATDDPRDRCIHKLFEAQVARTPDAVALVCGDESMTYGELNARANRLAHHLIELGVGPEVLVGLCVERSPVMIVGLLGILKAGGAYVPLDPAYPTERVGFMLHDCQASVLLAQQNLVKSLPFHAARVVCLDTDWTDIGTAPDTDPVCSAGPENLAYVIYTSGSTGRPKGVALEHRNTVALIAWAQSVFTVQELSGVLATTSICFDLSVYEVFVPLCSGGCVILVENALELANRSPDARVRLINTVPSAIAELLELQAVPDSVVTVNLAGEPLSTSLVGTIYRQTQVQRVYDLYGPSEDTTYSTCALRLPDAQATIGRPIANTRVYVLDGHRQPVPIGVPGELYLAGAGVARGYLNRPELTAEKFVADPFSEAPGALMYRTGDLVRWRPDGNLEFLGRLDQQIKLRGFRIELGEIEAVLGQHPQVRQAVVVLREDHPGDKRLAAYIVSQEAETRPAGADLRQSLHDKLPDYMVPGAFVLLDTLPLTPNGKVDRKALPAPDWDRDHLEPIPVAPRTPVEELLSGIWSRVLGLEHVGSHNNFFELGGHSLLATQVIARVRDVLAVDLPVRSLFEVPTVAGLAKRIERMRADAPTVTALPQRLVPSDARRTLSFAQERLWFLDQLAPGSATYNIPWALRLRGPLNVAALARSLSEIVRRHEALRTTFVLVDGQPQVAVLETSSFRLMVSDLEGIPASVCETEARRLAAEEASRPFDLSRDVMLRARVLELEEQDHILVLTMHHIASDGWSMGVFERELTVLYEAFAKNEPSPLPQLPIQYLDYAVWQRAWLQGAALERQLTYWKQQVAGAPAVLELPADFPRPAVAGYRGARREVVLDGALTQALYLLSRNEAVTPFMTLLAAFQVLLSRYSGQDDVLVGAPIAGRNRTEVEGLIGFFVNTLVLRTDLSGNPTFREVLKRVREVTLGAYAHQDLPFEKLVEELQPERNLSHSPLFQVMFVLQNAPSAPLELQGLTVSGLAIDNPTAKFDLTLSLGEQDGHFRGTLEYNTDLFQPETIGRLAGHFQVLLEGIVADPGRPIGELPLLTSAEQEQILVAWNRTETEYPRDQCLHELFEAQVKRTPETVAVVFEERTLTYRELNARANQVAQRLIGLGVGPGVLVGLCVDRSPEMLVGLLGILKAGGGYVPLDPSLPAERWSFLLEDSRAGVLVTSRRLAAGSFPPHAAQVVALDAEDSQPGEANARHPGQRADADSVAYVIYTSGSTGRPKGVEIRHRSVVNFLCAMREEPGLSEQDVLLAVTTCAFDISVLELFLPLVVGGRTVIVSGDTVADGARLASALADSRATVMQATPATWRLLLLSGWEGNKQLKCLCGGESLPDDLAEELLPRVGALWDLYGPTETTIWSTIHRVEPHGQSNVIGRPIANTRVYVLDQNRQLAPVGIPGELNIGGDGVARGYWIRPELTAEKFVPDPFRDVPGARMYRTGDLVRWRPDGNLEFLGRLDQQVKLRGFRIELGEIEAVLGQHPQVRQGVVLLREDHPGDKRLAAYIVPQSAAMPSTATDLQSDLHDKLPDYMVPSAFVILDALPLTPNGKVDRKGLPAPETRRSLSDEHDASDEPQTPLQCLLAQVWKEVLHVDEVRLYDNFFDLGGSSLTLVRAIAQIEKELGLKLAVAEVMMQTLAQLAALIERKTESPGVSG
ncbi:MAG: amino acid adenylation domain-containing protein [Planctomycetales bacterium]